MDYGTSAEKSRNYICENNIVQKMLFLSDVSISKRRHKYIPQFFTSPVWPLSFGRLSVSKLHTCTRAHIRIQTHTCTFYHRVHLAHGLQVYWWMRYLVPSAAPGFLLSRCFPSNSPCLGIATDPCSSLGSGIFIRDWPAKQNPSVTAGLFWHKLFFFFFVTFQGLYLIYACLYVCTHLYFYIIIDKK